MTESDSLKNIDEILIQSVLNLIASKEIDSDEQGEEINPIIWKQADDALNIFLTYTVLEKEELSQESNCPYVTCF